MPIEAPDSQYPLSQAFVQAAGRVAFVFAFWAADVESAAALQATELVSGLGLVSAMALAE